MSTIEVPGARLFYEAEGSGPLTCCVANEVLGEKLGRPVVEMPGGHVGFMSRPVEFAEALRPHLADRADDPVPRR